MTPHSQVGNYQRFGRTCYLLLPEDGNPCFILNVDTGGSSDILIARCKTARGHVTAHDLLNMNLYEGPCLILAFSRRFCMTEALFRPSVVNAEFVINKVALGPICFLVF
jgi:hypothetical protein